MKSFLILEDGHVFTGEQIGAVKETVFELVFSTSMTGYLETLTDPAYMGQGVVLTYPLIGNCGVNAEDYESDRVWPKALIVRELSKSPSNFRCQQTLGDFLVEHDVPGMEGIDTRALTRLLRQYGTMNAVLTTNEHYDLQECISRAKAYRVEVAMKEITTQTVTHIPGDGPRVAVLDCGLKRSMIQSLKNRNCDLTIYPATTDPQEILASKPDGIFLSNGPGNPKDYSEVVKTVQILCQEGIPVFGICLGHQLLALANGGDTEKMRYGHHGSNYPVRDIQEDYVFITAQNHGYEVKADAFPSGTVEITHHNVNDGTCEGIRYVNRTVFSVQFDPDGCFGPKDGRSLYDRFVNMMEVKSNA